MGVPAQTSDWLDLINHQLSWTHAGGSSLFKDAAGDGVSGVEFHWMGLYETRAMPAEIDSNVGKQIAAGLEKTLKWICK